MDARTWCMVLVCAGAASAGSWSWPDQHQADESVRIDTKVRFLDKQVGNSDIDKNKRGSVQSDESLRKPALTPRFYNQPQNAGRYPVRVLVPGPEPEPYRNDPAVYPIPHPDQSDGTIDSINYCKCVSTPDCNPRHDSAEVCGANKYLCCYKRPNQEKQHNSEVFNEIEDERPMLLPSVENFSGPFPPPPHTLTDGLFDRGHNVLVGPNGPDGIIGPNVARTPILISPDAPTGNIGPAQNIETGASAQRGVLVGPEGPTGVIGPYNTRPALNGGRVLGRGGSRGVLVGPGGPSGIIGPGYGQQAGPGLLVGPGGPTGTIGPGRQLLIGPGGPTGLIGPRRYYGN